MPITWNAEADAKLMAAIMKVCDVKIPASMQAEIAEIMGSGCTAKAISHRLTHFRKLAANNTTTTGDGGDKKSKKGKSGTKPAPKNTGKKSGKQAAARTPSPDDDDDENLPTPPATATRPKRGNKRDYAALNGEGSEAEGDDDDGSDKKVKIEVGEDIGEGLRQAPDLNEEADGADMVF